MVFEHRNYFASLGLSWWRWSHCWRCALAMALARGHRRARRRADSRRVDGAARARVGGSGLLRGFGGAQATRFAACQLLLRLGARDRERRKPDSPLVDQAFAALEHSAALPAATGVFQQAALILAARTGRRTHPVAGSTCSAACANARSGRRKPARWQVWSDARCRGSVPSRPIRCWRHLRRPCRIGDHPELFNSYANYALNVLHDPDLALRAWQEARSSTRPNRNTESRSQKLLIALNRGEEARTAKLPRSAVSVDSLGQYQREAQELEQRLQNHRVSGRRRRHPAGNLERAGSADPICSSSSQRLGSHWWRNHELKSAIRFPRWVSRTQPSAIIVGPRTRAARSGAPATSW